MKLQQLRKEWERLLDAVPAMVFFKNRDNRFVQVNRAYADAVGLSKEEIIGKAVDDFTPDPRMAAAYWEDDREVIESGRPKRNITMAHITDAQRWLRTEKIPFYNQAGDIIGVAGLAVDISEMKRAEAELDCRVRQQKAVADLGQRALSGIACDRLFDEASEMVPQVLGVDYGLILDTLPDGDGYQMRAGTVMEGDVGRHLSGEGGRPRRFRSTMPFDAPLVIQDLNEAPQLREAFPLVAELGAVSGVIVAVSRESQQYGVIGAFATRRRSFSQTDIDFLQGVGHILALAMERESADRAVQNTTRELRDMSSKLIEAQEEERHRIFRALHDELGQSLALLKLQVRAVQMKLDPVQKALHDDCEQTLTYITGIIGNVRRLCHDLTPAVLEDLGLSAALRWLFEEFARYFGCAFSMELDNVDHVFRRDAQLMIYRIFQEALNNIYRHAAASRVRVSMQRTSGSVCCEVADNGKGMDLNEVRQRQSPTEGLGLAAMGERARMLGGRLAIDSHPGRGTCIRVTIPIDERDG